MVTFGSGYYMPMDREYVNSNIARPEAKEAATNDAGVSIGDVGMSLGLGPIQNIPVLAARLRAGTKKVELDFMGAGKGSAQGHTPEMYGEVQRQALREMQKANEVNFTTHATVGVYGLAGMDQQGNFSQTMRNMALDEIKRAIDFAADVSRGGPVVVHTGEFQRPLVDADWNSDRKFSMYEQEEERATFRVVDARTGGIFQEARKNRKVNRPVWLTAKAGEEYFETGVKKVAKEGEKIYLDYMGNKIEPEYRVPIFDGEKFVTRPMGWNELVEESKEMTKRAKEFWNVHRNDKDDTVWNKSNWLRFKDAKSEDEIKIKPEEAYVIAALETNAANSRGWAYHYGGQFDEVIDKVKKLEKAKEFYKKIEDATSPDEKWKLERQFGETFGGLIPPETKAPSAMIDHYLKYYQNQIKQASEASSSQWSQAEEAMETIRHVESSETYAKKQAYDSYAKAGIFAMRKSNQLMDQGKIAKPIAVAMENLFPESYGSHPDELMDLVVNSRKQMVRELMEKNKISEEEARKKAEDHLVATFDTGHLNMWRKYWKGDPQKSIEENDKEFNRWMVSKVEEMAKKKIIGHLHLVDNYGYQDDHLAPGQGNTPIKEIIAVLKKHGYDKDIIVEPGADYTVDSSGFSSIMKTWKHLGSPVYGLGVEHGRGRGWGQVQYGYFGEMQPPYFIFAPYTPSEEWTLWSATPLE